MRLQEILGKIRKRVVAYETYDVFRRDLNVPLEAPEPSVDVSWHSGTAADVDRLTRLDHNCDEERRRELKHSLSVGSRMVFAEHEGQIVHLGFAHFHQLAGAGFSISLAPDICVLHDVRTIDAYRRMGFQRAGAIRRRQAALDAGARWAVSIVDTTNHVSRRNSLRSGLEIFGRIRTLSLFRRIHLSRTSPEVRAWCASPTPFDGSQAS